MAKTVKTATGELARLESELRELEAAARREGGFKSDDKRSSRLLDLEAEIDEIETQLFIAGI